MTLEEFVSELNRLAFWSEFTFAQNKFAPRPGSELELADNLVWLGKYAIALQLKERRGETENPDLERTWFQKKVINKATSQLRDTLRFLGEHEQIRITNARGHAFDIRGSDIDEITKVVVFVGGKALPEDCRGARFHVSRTAGFIHIIEAHDYLGILEKLRVPQDIRRYFEYRERVCPRLREAGVVVAEPDIMGAFLFDEALPAPTSREHLRRFVQDTAAFDLSRLIGNLHDHIHRSEQPYEYYRIMLEFAQIPRSMWREVMTRFKLSVEAAQERKFELPFRLAYPATGCSFMLVALDPNLPATGPQGEERRVRGLKNLTYLAMYLAKVPKGIGIQISKEGEYFQIDWCLLEIPWSPDPEVDAKLAERNPFRPATERR
jgi:hypothetical protein